MVNSITPFIDRMIHEAYCLSTRQEEEERRKERYTYLAELTDKINDYNNVPYQLDTNAPRGTKSTY